jgi:hypothetical protein
MVMDNASALGFWLQTPGGADGPCCSEAMQDQLFQGSYLKARLHFVQFQIAKVSSLTVGAVSKS